jgi:hypothetical protein
VILAPIAVEILEEIATKSGNNSERNPKRSAPKKKLQAKPGVYI